MAQGLRLDDRPPTTTSVRGEDWYARDLTGERHEQVLFVDVDLSECSADGAVFDECTFRGVRFNVARLTEVAFTNCTFVRCSWFDAELTGCKLTGSLFDGCDFGPVKVVRGDWSFVALPRADLRTVSFIGVRLREADLTGAQLDDGIVRDCDTSGVTWHRARLERCDLRGSDLSSLDPATVELAGARVTIDQAVQVAEALGLDVRPDDDRSA